MCLTTAPTGFRLAMRQPERVTAIISQNGNAYEEGLGDAWAPIRKYWSQPSRRKPRSDPACHPQPRGNALAVHTRGVQSRCGCAGRILAGYKSARAPGNKDIQLDLFLDYAANVNLYPEFQEYFRSSKPPLLAIWGKNDPFFLPPGAEAFRKDIPNAQVHHLTELSAFG